MSEIAEGELLTLQYTNVRWSSGSVANSTWQSDSPETAALEELIADGTVQAIVDKYIVAE